jgi:hypothetical protein
MSKALASTDQMADTLEWAINVGPTMSGRIDAIAHVAKLIQGEYDADFLRDVQAQNLDVLDGADPGYVRGYTEAWNTLYGMASGVSIDEAHRATF